MNAGQMIAAHLASCLPPDVPPCYRRIIQASFVGAGRSRVAKAELEMFDGRVSSIEVWQAGKDESYAHRWLFDLAGDAFYADGRWQRAGEPA